MSEASGSVDWDVMAASFDEEPDHGLRAPEVRAAWDARLRGWLPIPPADVLDLGCGTGSLALLAAEQGHRVTAVDSSPAMVELARAKLAGWDAAVVRGDAAEPPVGAGSADVVLVRHVLWALPEPGKVLRRWRELLRPGGRFVLVEGVWGTVAPAGIPVGRLAALLEPVVRDVRVESLSGDPLLWGKAVDDERYVVVGAV
ncbi:class I SAM-dependent methyltransferase [Streptomyces sp. NPDC059575]|uniref:class I SAM-dependent methyltransferase n=1 Tax=Streptomyces sp. NPDC059575 TaxID=3346872 RepID=UPI00367DCABE